MNYLYYRRMFMFYLKWSKELTAEQRKGPIGEMVINRLNEYTRQLRRMDALLANRQTLSTNYGG